jgi:hypothetical protein
VAAAPVGAQVGAQVEVDPVVVQVEVDPAAAGVVLVAAGVVVGAAGVVVTMAVRGGDVVSGAPVTTLLQSTLWHSLLPLQRMMMMQQRRLQLLYLRRRLQLLNPKFSLPIGGSRIGGF